MVLRDVALFPSPVSRKHREVSGNEGWINHLARCVGDFFSCTYVSKDLQITTSGKFFKVIFAQLGQLHLNTYSPPVGLYFFLSTTVFIFYPGICLRSYNRSTLYMYLHIFLDMPVPIPKTDVLICFCKQLQKTRKQTNVMIT